MSILQMADAMEMMILSIYVYITDGRCHGDDDIEYTDHGVTL